MLGSSDSMLRRALLAEAAIISLVAWLIGLLLVWMLGNATTLPFVDADLGLQKNLPIVLLTGLIALVTGLIAGLYPSMLAVDMELGDIVGRWNSGRIIGFTDNIKFTSLRQGENNIGFMVCKHPYAMPVSYIRLKVGTDVHAAVEHIRKTMADLDPAYPFDIEFYDTIFNTLYHKEENLRSLITVFSLLAIIISLVGIFGLVVFDTQYRRKEIGIRKVHGATIREILEMLNRSYIYIVLVCFILAAPVGYYGIHKWLESFAYKTPMYWWVYLMALAIVLAITIGTVTFQSWRSANANPVDSLKSE